MKKYLGNKKGAGFLAVLTALLIVVFLVGGIWFFTSQSGTATKPLEVLTAETCKSDAPYFDITVRNASSDYSSQTSGSSTYRYLVDTAGKGGSVVTQATTLTTGESGTDFTLNDKGRILVSEAQFIDKVVPFEIKKCGANKLDVGHWLSNGGNITVWDGGIKLTDNNLGGANNLSQIGAGSSDSVMIEIQSLGAESDDPAYILMELTNKTAVKDLIMSSITAGLKVDQYASSLPKGLSSANTTNTAGNYVEMFKVSCDGTATCPLQAGRVSQLNVLIQAETGLPIQAVAVYVDAFTGEDDVNDDGSFLLGAFEDASGDVVYEQQWVDFDFYIKT